MAATILNNWESELAALRERAEQAEERLTNTDEAAMVAIEGLQARLSELESDQKRWQRVADVRDVRLTAAEAKVALLSEALGKIELMATFRYFQPADYETVKRIARAALAAEPAFTAANVHDTGDRFHDDVFHALQG